MNCECYFVLTDLPTVDVVGVLNKLNFFEINLDLIYVDVLGCCFKEGSNASSEGLYSSYECDCREQESTEWITPPGFRPYYDETSSNRHTN